MKIILSMNEATKLLELAELGNESTEDDYDEVLQSLKKKVKKYEKTIIQKLFEEKENISPPNWIKIMQVDHQSEDEFDVEVMSVKFYDKTKDEEFILQITENETTIDINAIHNTAVYPDPIRSIDELSQAISDFSDWIRDYDSPWGLEDD